MKKLIKLFSLTSVLALSVGMTLLTNNKINVKAQEDEPFVIDFFVLPIQTGIYYWQDINGVYFIYNPNIESTTFADTTLLEFYNDANEDLTPLTNTTLTISYLRNAGNTTSSKVTELKDEIEIIFPEEGASFIAVYEDIEIYDIQQTIFDDSLFINDFVSKIEVKPINHLSITYDVSDSSTLNNIDDMFKMLYSYRGNILDYWLNFGGDYAQGYNDGYLNGGNDKYLETREAFGIYINGQWLSAEEYANIVATGLQEQIDDLERQLDEFQYGSIDYFLFDFGKWITPVIAIVIFGGGIFMLINRKREV